MLFSEEEVVDGMCPDCKVGMYILIRGDVNENQLPESS